MNYVDDNTALATPKADARPPTGQPSEIKAADWNDLCQAVADLRAAIFGDRATFLPTLALGLGKPGVVGNQTDPEFKWVVQNAGIDEPELALYARFEGEDWFKVDGVEVTGTRASVRDGTLGSHFEGFRRDGAVQPIFRLNSSPAPILEMGAVGGLAAVGGCVRASNVVTVTVGNAHGFGVGEVVTLHPGEAGFPAGEYTLTEVPSGTTFKFNSTGSNGSSTLAQDFSSPVDVGFKRAGHWELHIIVGGAAKMIFYADAVVAQERLVAASGFDLWSHTGGTGAQVINHPSGFFTVGAGQSSVVITCNKVTDYSKVFCVLMTDDGTLTAVKNVTVPPGGGSFTFRGNANATGAVKVGFQVLGGVDV